MVNNQNIFKEKYIISKLSNYIRGMLTFFNKKIKYNVILRIYQHKLHNLLEK